MCIYTYVYVCTNIYVCQYIDTYTYIYIYIYAYKPVHINQKNVSVFMKCVHLHTVQVHVDTHTCVQAYVCVYM